MNGVVARLTAYFFFAGLTGLGAAQEPPPVGGGLTPTHEIRMPGGNVVPVELIEETETALVVKMRVVGVVTLQKSNLTAWAEIGKLPAAPERTPRPRPTPAATPRARSLDDLETLAERTVLSRRAQESMIVLPPRRVWPRIEFPELMGLDVPRRSDVDLPGDAPLPPPPEAVGAVPPPLPEIPDEPPMEPPPAAARQTSPDPPPAAETVMEDAPTSPSAPANPPPPAPAPAPFEQPEPAPAGMLKEMMPMIGGGAVLLLGVGALIYLRKRKAAAGD